MGTIRRFAGYLRMSVIGGVERRIDPGLQLEQAVSEARRQDVELRTQAARVIALRTEIELRLDRAVDDREKLHDHAAAALREADAAARRGDAATAEKMTRGARAAAVRLEVADATVEGLKLQYVAAREQAEQAKLAVEENALELERLSARRLELVEQARTGEAAGTGQPCGRRAPSAGRLGRPDARRHRAADRASHGARVGGGRAGVGVARGAAPRARAVAHRGGGRSPALADA